jgi:hypothetical protein
MRILILLSAFLAALAGGVAHARPVGAVAAVSASASVRAERIAPVVAAEARVLLDRVNVAVAYDDTAPARRVPLYADRLLI